jgi:hypothetical protein
MKTFNLPMAGQGLDDALHTHVNDFVRMGLRQRRGIAGPR